MTKPDRQAAARAIEEFLRAIGRDPGDANLAGTGARVADAYIDELCEGYGVDVPALLAANLVDGATDVVIVRDIAVSTMCPHHLLPASGRATVAFEPRDRLLGIGAVARLVDAYSRRLTLQETIGEEVAGALMAHVKPKWAGCRLTMEHACMTARGGRHAARVESVALHGSVNEISRELAYRALGVGT